MANDTSAMNRATMLFYEKNRKSIDSQIHKQELPWPFVKQGRKG